MNNVVNNVAKGKKLEESLPLYAKHMMSLYNKMANMQFAMNYYTYFEIFSEYEGKSNTELAEMVKELNRIINIAVLSPVTGQEREDAVKAIDDLRNRVIGVMNILTTYVDNFSKYEYVSNRIEYRFKDEHLPSGYSDEEKAKEILRYIISKEDNAAINSKILDIIGQLPVRMVKNKFYEYVNEGINVYSEADKKSFDNFMYILRSASLLDRPEGFEEQYPEFAGILSQLDKINFSKIGEEEFKSMSDKLTYVTEQVNNLVDIYIMIAELINAVYVVILAAPYVEEEPVTDVCRRIGKKIYDLFICEEYVTIDEETDELMSRLEGKPEEIMAECAESEFALDTVRADYMSMAESVMCNHIYEALFMCEKLLSGSNFVDLSEEAEDIKLDMSYFEECKSEFLKELADLFASRDKLFSRAVMADILSSLPVFFNNMDEVKEYVIASLDNCRDEAEKLGCLEIVNGIIGAE